MVQLSFLLILTLLGTPSFGNILPSPKQVQIRWLDGRPDSMMEFERPLNTEQLVRPLDRCDAESPTVHARNYVFRQSNQDLFTIWVDLRPAYPTPSFRSICSGTWCFYFSEVRFTSVEECRIGTISVDNIQSISFSVQWLDGTIGYFPPVGDVGFYFDWDVKQSEVVISRIGGKQAPDGSWQYILIREGVGEILSHF